MIDPDELHKQLNAAVVCQALKNLCLDSSDRNGGVLVIAVVNTEGWEMKTVSRSIGKPGIKTLRYAKNANEKVARLFQRRCEGKDENTSSVSANPNDPDEGKRTYGGCIRAVTPSGLDVYFSFSGGPPDIDEAICYVIAEKLGLKTFPCENRHLPSARDLLKNCTLVYVPDR